MGKKNRNLRLDNEWKHNYCKEATGIIIDLAKLVQNMPDDLKRRINRLKAASAIYDQIQKNSEVFIP